MGLAEAPLDNGDFSDNNASRSVEAAKGDSEMHHDRQVPTKSHIDRAEQQLLGVKNCWRYFDTWVREDCGNG